MEKCIEYTGRRPKTSITRLTSCDHSPGRRQLKPPCQPFNRTVIYHFISAQNPDCLIILIHEPDTPYPGVGSLCSQDIHHASSLSTERASVLAHPPSHPERDRRLRGAPCVNQRDVHTQQPGRVRSGVAGRHFPHSYIRPNLVPISSWASSSAVRSHGQIHVRNGGRRPPHELLGMPWRKCHRGRTCRPQYLPHETLSLVGIYCAHPNLTLNLQALEIRTRFNGPMHAISFRAKYSERAISHQHDVAAWSQYQNHQCRSSSVCPQTARDLYDNRGLFVKFPAPYKPTGKVVRDTIRYDANSHSAVDAGSLCK